MSKLRGISFKTVAAYVIIIVVVAVVAGQLFSRKSEEAAPVTSLRQVKVASVAELAKASTPLTLLGTVSSKSEAIVRAESSGKLVVVYKHLGDNVSAGGVIAEFDNAAQKALVTQAEGAYEAAAAARDIAGISSGSANDTLVEQKIAALNAIASAFTAMDDAVHTKTDGMWDNPQDRSPHILFQLSDDKLRISIESMRAELEPILDARATRNAVLSSNNDLANELSASADELRLVRDYLDNLALALSRALPTQTTSQASIDGWKTTVGLSRTAISGILDGIIAMRNRLSQTVAAAEIASKQGHAGGGSSADAALKSALGNLEAARANLEKTIVRSPISGTINSLSVETGDIISAFSEVAVVSNNGTLEIVAYVTEDEKKVISVGAKVTVDGGIAGVVTRVAPAIDPKTKKIEVKIGISGSTSGFINGQSVPLYITRIIGNTKQGGQISIPIASLKLTPSGALVFSVNEGGILESRAVKTGALQGEKIVVLDGLTPDMEIVTDARGLKDGMSVEVSNP